MTVLQTVALPLGYVTVCTFLARVIIQYFSVQVNNKFLPISKTQITLQRVRFLETKTVTAKRLQFLRGGGTEYLRRNRRTRIVLRFLRHTESTPTRCEARLHFSFSEKIKNKGCSQFENWLPDSPPDCRIFISILPLLLIKKETGFRWNPVSFLVTRGRIELPLPP